MPNAFSKLTPSRGRKIPRIWSTLILLAVTAAAAEPFQAAARDASQDRHGYKFVKLDAPFPGVDQTLGYGINDLGMVVGKYNDTAGDHGFLMEDGTYTPIDVPFAGAQNTTAFGINNRRQIVGSYTVGEIGHGFLLKDEVFTPIDFPAPGVTQTQARGINDQGTQRAGAV